MKKLSKLFFIASFVLIGFTPSKCRKDRHVTVHEQQIIKTQGEFVNIYKS